MRKKKAILKITILLLVLTNSILYGFSFSFLPDSTGSRCDPWCEWYFPVPGGWWDSDACWDTGEGTAYLSSDAPWITWTITNYDMCSISKQFDCSLGFGEADCYACWGWDCFIW